MTDVETDLILARAEIATLTAENERLRRICRPVCPHCGLVNDRHFISNSCDRCGGDLRAALGKDINVSSKEGA